MRHRLAAVAIIAFALVVPVAASQRGSWTPALAAFGHSSWGPPVANIAALPACNGGTDGFVRVVLDTGSGDPGLRQCVSGSWVEVAGGAGGETSTGDGLQYGDGSGGFEEVDGSSVSGRTITFATTDGGGPDTTLVFGTSGANTVSISGDGESIFSRLIIETDNDTGSLTIGGHRVQVSGSQTEFWNGFSWWSDHTQTLNLGAFDDVQLQRTGADEGELQAGGGPIIEWKRASALNTATVYGALALASASGGTKPTCDGTIPGRVWYAQGGPGVADTLEICAKDAADAYAWRSLL